MAKTANCTIVGQTYALTTSQLNSYNTTRQEYVGYDSSGNKYYTYVLKFTTPTFSGKSEKIIFNLNAATISVTSFDFRYALCTTDENWQSYVRQYGSITEDSQIVTGTTTFSCTTAGTMKEQTIEINTSSLSPNTTYYLYLWASKNSYCFGLIDKTSSHTITLSYGGSYVYIDNGTSFDAYEIWIDNGTKWEQYSAYIDNGSGWDECG